MLGTCCGILSGLAGDPLRCSDSGLCTKSVSQKRPDRLAPQLEEVVTTVQSHVAGTHIKAVTYDVFPRQLTVVLV
jgi:hypothetical protein